jgi:hypothetical protein
LRDSLGLASKGEVWKQEIEHLGFKAQYSNIYSKTLDDSTYIKLRLPNYDGNMSKFHKFTFSYLSQWQLSKAPVQKMIDTMINNHMLKMSVSN